jgi:hypothetical protein
VATDPQYWEDIAGYLKASGTAVYEQDWLGDNAQSNFNLTDPKCIPGEYGGIDGEARHRYSVLHGVAETFPAKHELQ